MELYFHQPSVPAQACRAVTFTFTSKTAAWAQLCYMSELLFVIASVITLKAVSDFFSIDTVVS